MGSHLSQWKLFARRRERAELARSLVLLFGLATLAVVAFAYLVFLGYSAIVLATHGPNPVHICLDGSEDFWLLAKPLGVGLILVGGLFGAYRRLLSPKASRLIRAPLDSRAPLFTRYAQFKSDSRLYSLRGGQLSLFEDQLEFTPLVLNPASERLVIRLDEIRTVRQCSGRLISDRFEILDASGKAWRFHTLVPSTWGYWIVAACQAKGMSPQVTIPSEKNIVIEIRLEPKGQESMRAEHISSQETGLLSAS